MKERMFKADLINQYLFEDGSQEFMLGFLALYYSFHIGKFPGYALLMIISMFYLINIYRKSIVFPRIGVVKIYKDRTDNLFFAINFNLINFGLSIFVLNYNLIQPGQDFKWISALVILCLCSQFMANRKGLIIPQIISIAIFWFLYSLKNYIIEHTLIYLIINMMVMIFLVYFLLKLIGGNKKIIMGNSKFDLFLFKIFNWMIIVMIIFVSLIALFPNEILYSAVKKNMLYTVIPIMGFLTAYLLNNIRMAIYAVIFSSMFILSKIFPEFIHQNYAMKSTGILIIILSIIQIIQFIRKTKNYSNDFIERGNNEINKNI